MARKDAMKRVQAFEDTLDVAVQAAEDLLEALETLEWLGVPPPVGDERHIDRVGVIEEVPGWLWAVRHVYGSVEGILTPDRWGRRHRERLDAELPREYWGAARGRPVA